MELRESIWEKVREYPHYDLLQPLENYVFTSVNQEAKQIEYYDYSKRICDLKLFYLFFKLAEAEGNLEEKQINSNISKAIGLYVNEIEHVKDMELIEFRLELLLLLKNIIEEQMKSTTTSLIESIYTPYLEIDPTLLDVGIATTVDSFNLFSFSNTASKEGMIEINVHIMETNEPETVYKLNIPVSFTPTDIICEIIKTKLVSKSIEEVNEIVSQYKDMYMLNVCGCDEVFHGNKCKIISYKVSRIKNQNQSGEAFMKILYINPV